MVFETVQVDILDQIKKKLRSFKSCEHINEKGEEPNRAFGYLSLFSDPIDLAAWSQREYMIFCNFQQGSRYNDLYNPND